ncbi:MAG: hypothetical protein IKN87_00045 [Bacilli bacterium]|nr:hypothetical protein [Bacilli bacterium]
MALEEKVKDIITFCPHYYDIINTSFSEDDIITKKLIQEFCEDIFNISSNNMGTVNRLRVLDLVMYEYVLKKDFYRFAKDYFQSNANNIDVTYDNLLYSLVEVFKLFTFENAKENEEESNETRWL